MMSTIYNGKQVFSEGITITGLTILGVVAAAPADGDLAAGQCAVWVDESGNNLNFKVKYSDGITIKSGSIALA
jgi:hypothetical protein